jgi:hypothetical protein
MKYEVGSVEHGMISGPFGENRTEEGVFQRAQPVEIIRDRSCILRDGDGIRLQWPETTWRCLFATVEDSIFDPPTRENYNHHTRTVDLLKCAGPFKDHPYLVDIIRLLPVAVVGGLAWFRKQKEKSDNHTKAMSKTGNRRT